MSTKLLSLVGPVYNEEECLREFYQKVKRVCDALDYDWELILVDDGSRDRSMGIMLELQAADERVKVIELSRNFGHQVAMKAGLDHASGDAVILMDTDLQDPPEVIPAMLRDWEQGYDVVYAVRAGRQGERWFKKATAGLFYRLMRKIANIEIPLDAGDFRLISRRVREALCRMNEKGPYLRGMTSWVGFKQKGIEIQRDARYAGKTKFSLGKMLAFAWSGITHFSFLPLQLATYTGLLTALICFAWVLYTLYVALVLRVTVPGWASIMIAVLFLGSIQLITMGIIGSYLAKNFDQSRERPLYIVSRKIGFERAKTKWPLT